MLWDKMILEDNSSKCLHCSTQKQLRMCQPNMTDKKMTRMTVNNILAYRACNQWINQIQQ